MEKEVTLQKDKIKLRFKTKVCPTCDENFDDERTVCPADQTLLCPVGKDSLIGQQVQNFEIISRIGSGSSSNVYLAKALNAITDGTSDAAPPAAETVAVKVLDANLLSDPTALKRFQLEAQLVRALNHPQIAAVLDFGVLPDGRPYLILEYVQGETLKEYLEKNKKLDCKNAVSIFGDIIDAVEAAHHAGILHRDIKPSNIILDGDGRAKVLDFGIAKVIGIEDTTSVTLTGVSVGTPAYMSPEQCLGKQQDPRSDIYSLGCVMYECLSGSKVFPAENAFNCMRQHSFFEPTELAKLAPSVPAPIAAAIMKCLEKDADDRLQSLEELRQAMLGESSIVQTGRRKSNKKDAAERRKTKQLALYMIPFLFFFSAAIGLKLYQSNQQLVASATMEDPPELPMAGYVRQSLPHEVMTQDEYNELMANFHDFKYDGLWTKATNFTHDPTEQVVGEISPNGMFSEAHELDLPVFAGVRESDSPDASWYVLARDGLIYYDPKSKVSTSLPLPKDMPERLFCSGITRDTKRNRILVTSEHFEKNSNVVPYTVLLSYDPITGKWSEVAKINKLSLYGLGYSPTDDSLYTLAFTSTEDGMLRAGTICRLTADGAVADRIVPSEALGSLMSSQPPYAQIAIYDRFLIATLEGHQILIFDRNNGHFYRTQPPPEKRRLH